MDHITRYDRKYGWLFSFLDVAINIGDFSIENLSLPVLTLHCMVNSSFIWSWGRNVFPLCTEHAFVVPSTMYFQLVYSFVLQQDDPKCGFKWGCAAAVLVQLLCILGTFCKILDEQPHLWAWRLSPWKSLIRHWSLPSSTIITFLLQLFFLFWVLFPPGPTVTVLLQ